VCLGNRWIYILPEDEIVGSICSIAEPTWHNGVAPAGGVLIAPANGGSNAAGGVARAPADDTVVTTGNLGSRRARRLQIHSVQPTRVPSPSLYAPRRRRRPRRIESEGLLVANPHLYRLR
jgi:hypothetical protein